MGNLTKKNRKLYLCLEKISILSVNDLERQAQELRLRMKNKSLINNIDIKTELKDNKKLFNSSSSNFKNIF